MNTEIVRLPMTLRDLNHELRTSLTNILGMVDQLRQESLTSQQKSYVKNIGEAGTHLLELANKLLAIQQMDIK